MGDPEDRGRRADDGRYKPKDRIEDKGQKSAPKVDRDEETVGHPL
jgi:hypothetical protein